MSESPDRYESNYKIYYCTTFGIAEATALADTDVGDVAVTVEQCVVHSVAGPRPVEGLVDAVLEEADREPAVNKISVQSGQRRPDSRGVHVSL